MEPTKHLQIFNMSKFHQVDQIHLAHTDIVVVSPHVKIQIPLRILFKIWYDGKDDVMRYCYKFIQIITRMFIKIKTVNSK